MVIIFFEVNSSATLVTNTTSNQVQMSVLTFLVFRNLNDGGVLVTSGGAETGVDGQLGTVLLHSSCD